MPTAEDSYIIYMVLDLYSGFRAYHAWQYAQTLCHVCLRVCKVAQLSTALEFGLDAGFCSFSQMIHACMQLC